LEVCERHLGSDQLALPLLCLAALLFGSSLRLRQLARQCCAVGLVAALAGQLLRERLRGWQV